MEGDATPCYRRGDGRAPRCARRPGRAEEALGRGRLRETSPPPGGMRRRRSGRRPRPRGPGRESPPGSRPTCRHARPPATWRRSARRRPAAACARRSRPPHHSDDARPGRRSQSAAAGGRKRGWCRARRTPASAANLARRRPARHEVGHVLELADGGRAPVELLQTGAVLGA